MNYHVRPLGKNCAGTGEPLEPGSKVYSVLVSQDEELVRLDFSEAGWQGPPEGTIGQWTCRVPEMEQHKPKGLDPDAMLAYFEQILEDPNPVQEKMAYVLSLFLLQRRRLKLDGCRIDGEIEYLQLSGSRGEGPYEVRDQQLTEEEIKRLQAELHLCLESEWSAA